MRVLILRPEPGNAATARAVAAMGLEPVCIPLFEVKPVAWDTPDPDAFDTVVMTSANAARHGGPGLAKLTGLDCATVGEATAAAARHAGFHRVTTGEGDAAALARALSAQSGSGDRIGPRLLHLTGADHKPFAVAGTVAITVYDARPRDVALPDATIALVHSPRAGRRLAELTSDPAALTLVAISDAAAAACGSGWRTIAVADPPREQAMLETLAQVCKAPLR